MAGHSRANSVLNGELKKQSPDSALNSLPPAYLQCVPCGRRFYIGGVWMGVYNVSIKVGNSYCVVQIPDAESQKKMYENVNPSSGESVFTIQANFPEIGSAFDVRFKKNL